ncbi:aspartate-semialdehyde dehydrogenase [Candidatus Cytomitobacter primus]|uniref:Aspartate-semialdehyde dehydrogenase n=1 Tax=Candidatus Cytomitobacter primus TaxID=2066024 RepID=A0A5C0UGC8_9PROT|nr:aspartate-semialdehyde dehydrogenase [Candidatus Cytomitobacter primus]QEK38777.1 aspartate-semialdehyde dehydrogenase [Candidatus Cytomitobacter primus]
MFNIAIIGATGLIGRSIIDVLHERAFPIKNLYLLSRVEQEISFKDEVLKCTKLEDFDFKSVDIIFNATDKDVLMKYIGEITESGAFLIDKSEALRMDKDIPLIVPEVNSDQLDSYITNNKIISSPNCVAIPMSIIIRTLSHKTAIEQIFMTTFQSVSGAGNNGTKALLDETKKSFMASSVNATNFEKSIAFDILPKIGSFNSDFTTSEELKIKQEMQKILNNKLNICVTCTRVPVLKGHGVDLHIPCKFKDRNDAIKALKSSDVIHVCDRDDAYITQKESIGEDKISISRVRYIDGILSMWIAYDNVRFGGSVNGVKIAEAITKSL